MEPRERPAATPSQAQTEYAPRPVEARRSSRTLKIVIAAAAVVVMGPVVAALVARMFFIESFLIPSGAMTPTLIPGDHIFAAKGHYRLFGNPPRLGEIVVFIFPRDRTKDFIKRIVGLPGDVLETREGALYRNGAPVPRCSVGDFEYADETGFAEQERTRAELVLERSGRVLHLALYDTSARRDDGVWRIAPGEVFVMGDNRDNSHDSRFWGGVPIDDLKGQAGSIWWSKVQGRAGTDLHAPPSLGGDLAGALRRCASELGAR